MTVSTDEKRVWGIHTLNDDLFLKDNVIAIGWKEIGDLSLIIPDREDFRIQYDKVYPGDKKGRVANAVGMLFRFCHEAQIGDYVVFPSKKDRKINIGVIESDYYFEPAAYEYPNQRKVKWLVHVPRTSFSQGALYEAGSAMTFFMIKNYADEYLSALDKGFKKAALDNAGEDESIAATADEIIESTKDFVLKELSRQLKGYDLEVFIADLLNAMGYRTTISPHGGDSGIDIVAYKDELPPRITVQVKSQDSDIKETTIQSLKGAMMPGDYGVFITLSNYTKNAQKFLDANPIIRGINGSELVDLVLKYYDLLGDKHQKILPLKKVYIPVPKEK
ncbi:MAG: restriction endonuclease [Flexilinea sp.]|nr:restriction endonuclease [Flexilinea sp.]